MRTINVSFEDAEIEAIEKVKKEQSWRKFILERAATDSINEIHSKGINADALRGLCLEYDLAYKSFPKMYMGLTFFQFFLSKVTKTEVSLDEEGYAMWDKQIAELEGMNKEMEEK